MQGYTLGPSRRGWPPFTPQASIIWIHSTCAHNTFVGSNFTEPSQSLCGHFFPPPSIFDDFGLRCIGSRVGSSPGAPLNSGSMVLMGSHSSYEPERAQDSLSYLPGLPTSYHRGKPACCRRQHLSNVLPQQSGKSSLITLLSGINFEASYLPDMQMS